MLEDAFSRGGRTDDEEPIGDAELLRGYTGEKSEAAFAELVRRYLDLVYSAALRQVGGDVHRAHDVSQVVFTTLARKAGSLASHPVLAGWLYTATQHAAAKAVRTEARRSAREQEAHLMQEILAPGNAEIDWDRVRPVLDDAMRDLDDRDREAVLLRFFARRPFAEIGRALNLTEDAARMRVERALEKLHALLARRGVTSTSAALAVALSSQAGVAAPAGMVGSVTSIALAAPVAGVVGMVTGAWELMITTKLGLGVVGMLALLLTLGVATYKWRTREKAEQALAVVRQEHAVRTADLRAKERRAQAAEQEAVRLQKELDDARATATRAQAAAAAAQAAATWDPVAEGRMFLARHPEVKRALDDYVSASLRFQYAPMYRALGLTPEQIRRWEAVRGAGTTMGAPLADSRSISMPYGSRLTGENYSQQLRDALGEEGMTRLAEFGWIASARRMAADVAGSLYFTDTPLTPDQADQLVQVLVESRNTGPAARNSAYDWNAVIAKAGAGLTSAQVAVLAGKRATDQWQQALNRPRSETANPPSAIANPGK